MERIPEFLDPKTQSSKSIDHAKNAKPLF